MKEDLDAESCPGIQKTITFPRLKKIRMSR